jgi:hypothetical protein
MIAVRAAPVATEFASSARATFPSERRSAMIPDPTTAARSNPVPNASATKRWGSGATVACPRGIGRTWEI